MIMGTFSLVVILAAAFLYYGDMFFTNHALPGTMINGIKVGMVERKIIAQRLTQLLANKKEELIYFSLGNNFFEKNLEDTGVIIDIEGALDQIFNDWIRSSVWKKLGNMLRGFAGRGLTYRLAAKFNEAKFYQFIKIFESFERAPVDYNLTFDGYDFKIAEGKEGIIIDREALKKDIGQILWAPNRQIAVRQKIIKPEVNEKEVLLIQEQIRRLLDGAPYTLKFKERIWYIERQDIGAFVIFKKEKRGTDFELTYDLDKEKIAHFIDLLAPQINSKEQDVVLSYDKDNKIIVLDKGQVGHTIDIGENTELIYQSLLDGKKEITLKITDVLPRVNSDNLQELGIEKLLGTGKTNFEGSPGSRIHNITVGTNKFNKILIPPNATFSFNEALGSVGPEAGYKAELVIKDNKIYPEYGGGLCQVSTTMFRAVVNSGLEVLQRSPHSIMVRYYNPAGFDAAIYPPNPDLKFRNNTSGHIYIQSRIVKNEVIFEIYGKDEGKSVKVIGPSFLEKKDDGSAKTILTQEVWQDGKQIYKKSFYSTYKPYELYPVLRNPLE